MVQFTVAREAVALLDARGWCALKVVVKLVKFILDKENHRILWQFSITGVVCGLKKHTVSDSIQRLCLSWVLNSLRKSGSSPDSSEILLGPRLSTPPKF